MKKILLLILTALHFKANAQGDSLYVSGRFLYNNCGQKIILRGVNYPVLDDWDFPTNMNNGNERLSEIEKIGANAVRIQWYVDYGQATRPGYTLKDLDSLLTRCARMKMIPVIGLWDLTTQNNWQAFNTNIISWYLRQDVKNLIKKHSLYLVINIANEMGHYEWGGDLTINETNYKTNYKNTVSRLRAEGINVPLLIDAPDGGTRLNLIRKTGAEIINHDPLRNILFGVHTYWAYYPNWQRPGPAEIANEFELAVNLNLPLVIGEVANIQDESNELCKYDIGTIYPEVLKTAIKYDLGYFAWCWHKDGCASRQVTANGTASQLTAWGNDVINNTVYGIKNTAKRSDSTFIVCACRPYRIMMKKCRGNRYWGPARVPCTSYRNKYTGNSCGTVCEPCNTSLQRRDL